MAVTSIRLECPSCGAAVSQGQKECASCCNPLAISTFNSVASMPMPLVNKYAVAAREALQKEPNAQDLNNTVAFCYLKLKLYDKALVAFEKAMEDNFDNSETFFYAAVCLLKGKKAFVAPRDDINTIEEYINAALAIEPKGIYYYFGAYIKQDYYERKFLNTSPTSQELLATANEAGLSDFDVSQLRAILGT
jgi:tetratricopeptide (TPR) repeat protein